MKTYNAFLTFRKSDGSTTDVSVSDILESGYPIDPETGDDLILVSDDITNKE